jgi:hypothetical protein
MAYHDVDGTKYWISERESDFYNNRDPFKNAAEVFARDVEVYLYREQNPDGSVNPLYQNPDFLAWAIARYDACKTGSGHEWHLADFDLSNPIPVSPVPPPESRISPGGTYDGAISVKDPAPKAGK